MVTSACRRRHFALTTDSLILKGVVNNKKNGRDHKQSEPLEQLKTCELLTTDSQYQKKGEFHIFPGYHDEWW